MMNSETAVYNLFLLWFLVVRIDIVVSATIQETLSIIVIMRRCQETVHTVSYHLDKLRQYAAPIAAMLSEVSLDRYLSFRHRQLPRGMSDAVRAGDLDAAITTDQEIPVVISVILRHGSLSHFSRALIRSFTSSGNASGDLPRNVAAG